MWVTQVVGLYFSHVQLPSQHLCLRCFFRPDATPDIQDPASVGYQASQPQTSSTFNSWSETPEFMSSRDSFTALDEGYGFAPYSQAQGFFGTLPPELDDPQGVLGEPLRPTATYGYFPDPQQVHQSSFCTSASIAPRQAEVCQWGRTGPQPVAGLPC